MEESSKKRFKPYLVAGLLLAFIGYYMVKLYTLAPDENSVSDPLGMHRFSWMGKHPFGAIKDLTPTALSLGTAGICFLVVLLYYLKPKDSGKYRYGEEHGSAKHASFEELKKFRDSDPMNDMIFSQRARMGLFNKRLPFSAQLNKNTLTIGTPGDWKTRAIVKPNLMQANSSFVITDPKGLLVHEVGHLLEEKGYKIKIFDLVTLTNSNQFNVFHYMTSENDIDRVTESLINGTTRTENRGEDFWVQGEMLVIRSLIGYLYFEGVVRKEFDPHIGQIADLLRHLKREDPDVESPVELMFQELDKKMPNNYACKQFSLLMNNFKGATLMSVLAMASSRFSVFDHDDVQKLVAKDTMEMENWQKEKTAVFIALPETDKSFNFLANLMFVTMLRILPMVADNILQGKDKTFKAKDLLHLRLYLDEFAQLGKIPYFVESQASVRSREISIDPIIQAINQIKSIYKDDWKTILNNCGALLYLGTNDEDTMKYFSMRAGKQTINLRQKSQTYSIQGSSSESIQTISRDLMTPDEIARIGIEEILVFIAKQNVFRDRKYDLLSHPNAHLLADSPDDLNWYEYKRAMSDIEEWYENVKPERLIELTSEEINTYYREVLQAKIAEEAQKNKNKEETVERYDEQEILPWDY